MLQRSWFTNMNRIIKFIIGSVTGIITAIICMMMEDALHNPDDMSFKVFRFIVFFILFSIIAGVIEFIYRRFLSYFS